MRERKTSTPATHARRGRRLRGHAIRLALSLAMLVPASAAMGDIPLADGKVSIDALFRANARVRVHTQWGFSKQESYFYRNAALLGLRARLASDVSLRCWFDVADIRGKPAQDLYLDLELTEGLTLRAGQMGLPLGFEAETPWSELRLIDNSIASVWLKPVGMSRDVGVLADFRRDRWALAAAVVNGNGRNNLADDNRWKDPCARAEVQVLSNPSLVVQIRGYWGHVGGDGVPWRTLGAGIRYSNEAVEIVAEGQLAGDDEPKNSLYVQGAFLRLPLLEPVVRYQMEFLSASTKYRADGGLSFHLWDRAVKLMLNYAYSRTASSIPGLRETEHRASVQLQGAL